MGLGIVLLRKAAVARPCWRSTRLAQRKAYPSVSLVLSALNIIHVETVTKLAKGSVIAEGVVFVKAELSAFVATA